MVKKGSVQMNVNPEQLEEAAKEFVNASEETDEMVARLGKTVKELENHWADAGQQKFYMYYREWHTHMGGFSKVLMMVAREMEALAERFKDADH